MSVNTILRTAFEAAIKHGEFVPGHTAKTALPAVLALDRLTRRQAPNLVPLVLEARMKDYTPQLNAAMAAAQRDGLDGQSDFSEFSVDFSRVIRTPVAMDEAPGAVRLPPLSMTYPQLIKHIELAERKAAQTWAKASRYRRLIAQHPEWQQAPERTLEDVLGLAAETQAA